MTLRFRLRRMWILYMPGVFILCLSVGFGLGVFATVARSSGWLVLAVTTFLTLLGTQAVTIEIGLSQVVYKRRSLLLPARGWKIDRERFSVHPREDDPITGDRPSHVEILGVTVSDAVDRDESHPPAFQCDRPRTVALWILANLGSPQDRATEPFDNLPSARVIRKPDAGPET